MKKSVFILYLLTVSYSCCALKQAYVTEANGNQIMVNNHLAWMTMSSFDQNKLQAAVARGSSPDAFVHSDEMQKLIDATANNFVRITMGANSRSKILTQVIDGWQTIIKNDLDSQTMGGPKSNFFTGVVYDDINPKDQKEYRKLRAEKFKNYLERLKKLKPIISKYDAELISEYLLEINNLPEDLMPKFLKDLTLDGGANIKGVIRKYQKNYAGYDDSYDDDGYDDKDLGPGFY